MRIVVVCGAGASSTFVAQRLRRACAEQGLAHTARAVPLQSVPACLDDADLLLVGPHLADRMDQLAQDAADRALRVVPLPHDIFGDLDGSRTLAIVTAAAADAPHHTDPADAGRRREHP